MFNRRVFLIYLLIIAILFLGACSKKEEKTASQVTIDKVATSSPSNADAKSETRATPVTEPLETTGKPTNDSPGPGEINIDLYKNQTMMFHCVVLESIALKNNAAIPALAFSDNYVNIITGEKKQGLNQKYFEEYLKGNNIYKVDSISKLVDYKNIETLTFDEIMKSPEKYFVNNKANFQYEKGDVLVIVHPANGSPLKDGWVGIYRMVNKQRKMVAGSF